MREKEREKTKNAKLKNERKNFLKKFLTNKNSFDILIIAEGQNKQFKMEVLQDESL